MTTEQLAIICGLIGTIVLTGSSYSMESMEGSFFAEAVKSGKPGKSIQEPPPPLRADNRISNPVFQLCRSVVCVLRSLVALGHERFYHRQPRGYLYSHALWACLTLLSEALRLDTAPLFG